MLLIIFTLIFSGLIQSLLAFGQFVTGSTLGFEIIGETEKGYWSMRSGSSFVNRVSGSSGHPNRLSSFLGTILHLNLVMIFALFKKRIILILLVFSFFFILAANILTFSRGGLVSFAIAAIISSYFCINKVFGNRFLTGLFIIFFFTISITSALTFIEPLRDRFFKADYGALATRIPLAQVSKNIISENPILGVGPGSYCAVSHYYDTTRQSIMK